MIGLLSVTDKQGIIEIVAGLSAMGWQFWATDGTANFLREQGYQVVSTTELLKKRPIMSGRVKTLDWPIFASLLCDRSRQEHLNEANEVGLPLIDLVVADLYPFEREVKYMPTATDLFAQSFIDIGGMANIRAAAKNFPYVIPVLDRGDYNWITQRIVSHNGDPQGITYLERRALAAKVFNQSSKYDLAIADFMSSSAKLT